MRICRDSGLPSLSLEGDASLPEEVQRRKDGPSEQSGHQAELTLDDAARFKHRMAESLPRQGPWLNDNIQYPWN